jgi:hypothetical protein
MEMDIIVCTIKVERSFGLFLLLLSIAFCFHFVHSAIFSVRYTVSKYKCWREGRRGLVHDDSASMRIVKRVVYFMELKVSKS